MNQLAKISRCNFCNNSKTPLYCLFHMKITLSVIKSCHQDHCLCYLHLPICSYTYTLFFCWKKKGCCDHYLPQQTRPQTTAQLYIFQDYSSVRTGFNLIKKCHTLPASCQLKSFKFQSSLFYSELNEVCSNYA